MRFESTRTIAGTHRLHSFRPISSDELEVRDFSFSEDSRRERISLKSLTITNSALKFSSIKGYVTVKYDGSWWLACVTQTMPDSGEVEVSFLHPHGPARSFKYPSDGDILVISCHDVLTVVNPSTATGRAYTLSEPEIIAASAEKR